MLDHYCISCVFVLQTLYIYERSTWLPAVLCWRPHDSQFICVDNHGTVSCSLCFRPRVCQLFSVLTTTWLLAVFCVDNQVTLSCFLCFRPRDSQLFSLFQTTWTCRMWGYPTRIQTRGRSGFPHYNSAQILTCIFVPILSIFPSYIYCTLNKDKDGVRSNWANGRTDPLLSPDGIKYIYNIPVHVGVRSNWANGWTDPLLSPDGLH